MRGMRAMSLSKRRLDRRHWLESLMRERYWLTAPTEGLMLISLSLSRMSMRVLR